MRPSSPDTVKILTEAHVESLRAAGDHSAEGLKSARGRRRDPKRRIPRSN